MKLSKSHKILILSALLALAPETFAQALQPDLICARKDGAGVILLSSDARPGAYVNALATQSSATAAQQVLNIVKVRQISGLTSILVRDQSAGLWDIRLEKNEVPRFNSLARKMIEPYVQKYNGAPAHYLNGTLKVPNKDSLNLVCEVSEVWLKAF